MSPARFRCAKMLSLVGDNAGFTFNHEDLQPEAWSARCFGARLIPWSPPSKLVLSFTA